MRVINPNGSITEMTVFNPVIIKREVVNDKVIRKVYLADNLTDDVNGLLFESETSVFRTLVGNISVDAVKEVISKIGKTGVIDLTELGHLKHVTTYNKLLAETEPYYIKWSWFRAEYGENDLSGKIDRLSNELPKQKDPFNDDAEEEDI